MHHHTKTKTKPESKPHSTNRQQRVRQSDSQTEQAYVIPGHTSYMYVIHRHTHMTCSACRMQIMQQAYDSYDSSFILSTFNVRCQMSGCTYIIVSYTINNQPTTIISTESIEVYSFAALCFERVLRWASHRRACFWMPTQATTLEETERAEDISSSVRMLPMGLAFSSSPFVA